MVSDKDIFIETNRLYIKKLDRNDYLSYYSQQKDPFLMTYFGGPREDEGIVKIFDLWMSHQEKYGFSIGMVYLKQAKTVIGRSGLAHLDLKPVDEVEIGYYILEPYCHNGYATEAGQACIQYAFETVNAPKVYATMDLENIASCRVAEKLKLRFEKQDHYDSLNKVVNFYSKTKEQYLSELEQ